MHTYIFRSLILQIQKKLDNNPVLAILGPRQCGKSTLVSHIIENITGSIMLDLESPRTLSKLQQDPEDYFISNKKSLICLDEIQRFPEIFPIIRSTVDRHKKNGQFIVLGSASPELIKQSSESLAGRIAYLELTPFLWQELENEKGFLLKEYWLKGGYPRSFLNTDKEESLDWRLNYIQTYLERDIPNLGLNIPAPTLHRLWLMCAHMQGETINQSRLGESLGITNHKVRHYLDILEQTFLIRQLPPFELNVKKRVIKSPKVYIRDSGLLHALLDIESFDDLLGHPVYGASWEGIVIENLISSLPRWTPYFYRTSNGTEIDLILRKGMKNIAIECKASSAPTVSKGFWNALEDIQPEKTFIIAPVDETYSIKENVLVTDISTAIERIQKYAVDKS